MCVCVCVCVGSMGSLGFATWGMDRVCGCVLCVCVCVCVCVCAPSRRSGFQSLKGNSLNSLNSTPSPSPQRHTSAIYSKRDEKQRRFGQGLILYA